MVEARCDQGLRWTVPSDRVKECSSEAACGLACAARDEMVAISRRSVLSAAGMNGSKGHIIFWIGERLRR